MRVEQYKLDNPEPHLLEVVLADPIFRDIPITAGKVDFAPPGLYRPSNRSLEEVARYVADCDKMGVRPYHSARFTYDRRFPHATQEALKVDEDIDLDLTKTPIIGYDPRIDAAIRNEIWRRVSRGGKPHLLRYQFREPNLRGVAGFEPSGIPARGLEYVHDSGEWAWRKRDGYQVDQFKLDLETNHPDTTPDTWLEGSSDSLVLNVRNMVYMSQSEGMSVPTRERTAAENDLVEKLISWINSLKRFQSIS